MKRTALSTSVLGMIICGALFQFPLSVAAKTKLTVWNPYGAGYWQQAYVELANRYQRLHPDLDINIIPSDWGIVEKLVTQATAGIGPDLVICTESMIGKLAWRGFVENLDPYIKRDKFPINAYVPEALKGYQYKYKKIRGQFGLPILFSGYGMYYNKNLFNNRGMAFPSDDWNIDEFRKVVQKLTWDNNGDGKTDFWGLDMQVHANRYIAFIRSYGAEFLDEDRDEFLLDSKEGTAAVQTFGEFYWKYKAVNTWTFAQGKTGLYMNAAFEINDMNKSKFDWDITTFPYGPTGLRSVAIPTNGAVIPKFAKNKEKAWGFLKYLTSADSQEYFTKAGMAIPTLVSATKVFLDIKAKPENRKVLYTSMKGSHATAVAPYADDIYAVTQPLFEKMCAGKIDAVQVIKTLTPQAKTIIAKYKARM